MKRPTILVAESDDALRDTVEVCLSQHGFAVIETSERTAALRSLQERSPDLAVIGFSERKAWDGLELVNKHREGGGRVPLILVSTHSSEERVLAALRAGVNDYFKLPFSCEELIAGIHHNLSGSRSPTYEDKKTCSYDSNSKSMIGQSPPMREIKDYLPKVAASDSTLLITGETGTGKELAAELVHQYSSRCSKPLICINSAAIPETLLESELFGYEKGAFTGASTTKRGKFEQASGGTVFLDEIGDMTSYAQAKILRVIENKEVHHLGGKKRIPLDVRVIAATNKDPERLIAEGKFRKDLYYRLNVARMHMPPLRGRKEDIPHLLSHYIGKLNGRFGRHVKGFAEDTLEALLHYDWPGNVRELKNLLEATFINPPLDRIAFADLPQPFRVRVGENRSDPQSERDKLLAALFSTNWNKSKAAQKLCWSRMTLYRKMAKYRITQTKVRNEPVTPQSEV